MNIYTALMRVCHFFVAVKKKKKSNLATFRLFLCLKRQVGLWNNLACPETVKHSNKQGQPLQSYPSPSRSVTKNVNL